MGTFALDVKATRLHIFGTLVVLLLLGTLLGAPLGAAVTDSDTIPEDMVIRYRLRDQMEVDDKLKVDVDFKDLKRGDVYIMTKVEYDKLTNNMSFEADETYENTRGAQFTWKMTRETTWYLVVDNADNAHSGDAEPDGELRYTLIYTIEEPKTELDTGGLIWTVILFIVFIGCAIYIYKDAQDRQDEALVWIIFACLCGPIALLVWFFARTDEGSADTYTGPQPGAPGTPGYPPQPPPQAPYPPEQYPPTPYEQQQQPPYQQPAYGQQPPPQQAPYGQPAYQQPGVAQQLPGYPQQPPGYPQQPAYGQTPHDQTAYDPNQPQAQYPPRKPPEY